MMTLIEAMQMLVEKHGSQAEAARQCDIHKSYWSRMMSGVKDWPGDETLAKMGLRRVVDYEWIKEFRK
jgi:hypothetical protein